MPVIRHKDAYRPPLYQFNGHLQTILPSMFRKGPELPYERERLILSDGDFVDLDWLVQSGRKQLALLSHGLEGNSHKAYIKGMASLFFQRGWDVLAWNCRSCSGELNLRPRLYNHGEIGDIAEVILHALRLLDYEQIVLIGFSMGGNILLKYLGVHGREVPEPVRRGVAFSAPVVLRSSVEALEQPENAFYKKHFLRRLKAKVTAKARQYPDLVDLDDFQRIGHWSDFDEYFSAPLNGYASAEDFYQKGSSLHFLDGLQRPVLLVNAWNDPILGPACYPETYAGGHDFLFLEAPPQGGHVGFALPRQPHTWAEYRALEFASSC